MKKYLVGGAVRDELLGLPVRERDWMVVGETPDSMTGLGFKPVGKDFPVFLHPETHEEYALARTEKKTAPGYKGFAINAAPDVTLEQDLLRRDLTINAMARDENGGLIDPYGGRGDLDGKLLRHVSPAFTEDPVRILRVARFSARYAHLGFRIADETLALMQDMVEAGEVDALVAERVWAELSKALGEESPNAFFDVLKNCRALSRLFPEIDRLFGVPQPKRYHPEIDTGVHTMMVLQQAASLSASPLVRFAALTHDLGKGVTPREIWPSHRGHESRGLPILDQFCARLRVPNEYKKLASRVMRYHGVCHRAFELRPATLVDTLTALGAINEHSSMDHFLLTCEADARGREGLENNSYPQAAFFRQAQLAAIAIDPTPLVNRGLSGQTLGLELRRLRIEAVAECREKF